VPKRIKEEKEVTIFGDFDGIDNMRQNVVAHLAMEELERVYRETGYVPSEMEMQNAMSRAEAELRQHKDIFIDMVEDVVVENLETIASFTNETTDTTVTVRNLLDMAGLIEEPEARNDFFTQAMELMGLEIPESLRRGPVPAPTAMPTDPMAMLTGGASALPPEMGGVPTGQNVTTSAVTA
jgi:hypothetical protein